MIMNSAKHMAARVHHLRLSSFRRMRSGICGGVLSEDAQRRDLLARDYGGEGIRQVPALGVAQGLDEVGDAGDAHLDQVGGEAAGLVGRADGLVAAVLRVPRARHEAALHEPVHGAAHGGHRQSHVVRDRLERRRLDRAGQQVQHADLADAEVELSHRAVEVAAARLEDELREAADAADELQLLWRRLGRRVRLWNGCVHASIVSAEGSRNPSPGRVRTRTRPFRPPPGVRSNVPMEAATPLRKAHVRTIGDRLVVDGLVIDDESAVRLVREREETGADPVRVVVDAVEIGARVLDREQAGANAEFVKGELDKATREVEVVLAERTREVTEQIGRKVNEAFGAESDHVTKTIQKHFSDDSAGAVQNRVREVVAEALTHVQQSLVQQFSSADARNPLAEFKAGVLRAVETSGQNQARTLQDMTRQLAGLQQQLGELRVETEKAAELEAERERGTAKGR